MIKAIISINEKKLFSICDKSPNSRLTITYVTNHKLVFMCTGALESDYPVDEDILKTDSYPQFPADSSTTADPNKENKDEDSGIGGISFVQCATGSTGMSPVNSQPVSRGTVQHQCPTPHYMSQTEH